MVLYEASNVLSIEPKNLTLVKRLKVLSKLGLQKDEGFQIGCFATTGKSLKLEPRITDLWLNPYLKKQYSHLHVSISYNQILQVGSRGPLVADVQEKLEITPVDGIYGPQTVLYVREWQDINGLLVDGIIGPQSLKVLLG